MGKTDNTFTLTELWQWHANHSFKAKMKHWESDEWFMLVGQSPIGRQEFYGYCADGYGIGYPPNEKGWIKK